MFDLKIASREQASILVAEGWPTRIVSLLSTDLDSYGTHHLHLRVDDVAFTSESFISPSLDHLRTILDFSADLTADDRLLVHCFGGVSRSTAIAIGILIHHGMTYREAFERVAQVRSLLMPNELFIKHIDQHFGLDGQLINHVSEHRKSSIGMLIPTLRPEPMVRKILRLFG